MWTHMYVCVYIYIHESHVCIYIYICRHIYLWYLTKLQPTFFPSFDVLSPSFPAEIASKSCTWGGAFLLLTSFWIFMSPSKLGKNLIFHAHTAQKAKLVLAAGWSKGYIYMYIERAIFESFSSAWLCRATRLMRHFRITPSWVTYRAFGGNSF